MMDGNEILTADQVEEDWKRALDSASEAVSFCADSKLLPRAYAAHEVELIRAEREWLARISPTLRLLFPPVSGSAVGSPDQRWQGRTSFRPTGSTSHGTSGTSGCPLMSTFDTAIRSST